MRFPGWTLRASRTEPGKKYWYHFERGIKQAKPPFEELAKGGIANYPPSALAPKGGRRLRVSKSDVTTTINEDPIESEADTEPSTSQEAASLDIQPTHEATNFEWSPLREEDAVSLFKAQNDFVSDHHMLTRSVSSATFEDWKLVLGYPEDDQRRMEFIRKMPSASTKHGDRLHCLKLTCYEGAKITTAGYIDFEVKKSKDALSGKVREIYIRSIFVDAKMRRRGCGTRLFDAMLKYLGEPEADFDVVRLYAMDLNEPAIKFYFKLGFKITQWFVRRIGSEPSYKVVFLCMQKLCGQLHSDGNHEALAVSLQDMPPLFAEQVVGESIDLFSQPSLSEGGRRGHIMKYNLTTRRFSIAFEQEDSESPVVLHDVCVNDLYSSGLLTFKRSPSTFLNERQASVVEDSPSSKKRKAWSSSTLQSRIFEQIQDSSKSSKHSHSSRETSSMVGEEDGLISRRAAAFGA
jgi:ribosomal protein S18 acetylase RimI-like enzyme